MCIVHCQLCFHMSGSWEILFVMFYFRRVATHKKCLCSIWPKSFVGAGCKAIRLLLEAKMHTRRTMNAMSNPKSTVRIAFWRTYRSRNFTCRSWAIGQTGGTWVYSVTFGTKAQSSLKQSWTHSYKGVSRVESKLRIGGHHASCTWLLMQFGRTVIVCHSHTCKRLQKSSKVYFQGGNRADEVDESLLFSDEHDFSAHCMVPCIRLARKHDGCKISWSRAMWAMWGNGSAMKRSQLKLKSIAGKCKQTTFKRYFTIRFASWVIFLSTPASEFSLIHNVIINQYLQRNQSVILSSNINPNSLS